MVRFLALIGVIAIVFAVAAAVYFFGGFYNVAALQDDPAIVKSALANVRKASISRHAKDSPPASLDDAALIRSGARAFRERGCTNCHGGPGVEWAKFSEGMRPDPPDLKEVVNDRTAAQVFWVIKNGIDMTGMPSFGSIEVPDQEIWSIAAFVKKLPTVSDEDFKAWTAPAGGSQ
jgi:cbb3-type cytochrome c oxidase subunit III